MRVNSIKRNVFLTTLLLLIALNSSMTNVDGSMNIFDIVTFGQLPNEISEINASLLNIKDPNLQRLSYIIGFLPRAEQEALAKAYIPNSDRVFDINKVREFYAANKIFPSSNQSFANLLTGNSRKFRRGLSCIYKVSNQFAGSDGALKSNTIQTDINTLLSAQIQFNNCQSRMAATMLKLMQNRRRFLFTTVSNQNQAGVWNNRALKDYFLGFKYTQAERSELIEAFRQLANCGQTFNTQVYARVMESNQLIAQFPVCKGDSNPNAGQSSSVSTQIPTMSQDGKTQIGVNNANGVRPDSRTKEGYLLNGGYGLGTGTFKANINGHPAMSYPSNVNNIMLALINQLGLKYFGNSQWNELISRMQTNLLPESGFRPSSHLQTRILDSFANGADILQNEFSQVDRGVGCKLNYDFVTDSDYLFYCYNGVCNCIGLNCPSDLMIPMNLGLKEKMSIKHGGVNGSYSSSNTDMGFTFELTDSFVASFCFNNARYVYSQATNSLVGGMVEFSSGSQTVPSLGQAVADIHQACTGSFMSGSKNNKDACRGPMTDSCGIELDYTCKKSGLYDYLAATPLSNKELPPQCDKLAGVYNEGVCFDWITKRFFLGSMTIRPSLFLGLNLYVQGELNRFGGVQPNKEVSSVFPLYTLSVNYYQDPSYFDTGITSLTENWKKDIQNDLDLVVDGAYHHTFPSLSSYQNDIQTSVQNLNSGKHLELSLLTFIIVVLTGVLL